MCLECAIRYVAEIDDDAEMPTEVVWPTLTDQMLAAAAAKRALYALPGGSTGGPLHIVVDDYNLDDASLLYCALLCARDGSNDPTRPLHQGITAKEWYGDGWEALKAVSIEILELLRPMSLRERATALAFADGWVPDAF